MIIRPTVMTMIMMTMVYCERTEREATNLCCAVHQGSMRQCTDETENRFMVTCPGFTCPGSLVRVHLSEGSLSWEFICPDFSSTMTFFAEIYAALMKRILHK